MICNSLLHLGPRIDLKLPPQIAVDVLCNQQVPLPQVQLDKIPSALLDKLMPFQIQGVMYLGFCS